jgi:hypothetical protein
MVKLLTVVLLITSTLEAAAQPATTAPAPPPELAHDGGTRWYGYQTLAVDAVALGVLALAVEGDDSEVAWLGLGLAVAGPAMVHATHGRTSAAVGSSLLRLGAVAAGLSIGAALETCGPEAHSTCRVEGAMIGALVGWGTAAVIDGVVVARERRAPRVVPTFATTGDGVRVGLGGRF